MREGISQWVALIKTPDTGAETTGPRFPQFWRPRVRPARLGAVWGLAAGFTDGHVLMR